MTTSTTSFRPALENLEGRDVPALIGYETYGLWNAGHEKIAIFAEDFSGAFTAANARSAWVTGLNQATNANLSLGSSSIATSVHTHQANGADHLLIGWYNETEHTGGWLAGDFASFYQTLTTSGPRYNQHTDVQNHTTLTWMTNDGQSGYNQEGWQKHNWVTNHNNYNVGLSMVATSDGNVLAYFNAPSAIPAQAV
jgi:hypothetical protein